MYRLFDAERRLLYVGISNLPGARFMEHAADKEWWPEVADHVIVWHPDRKRALAAESEAIFYEKPIYNKDRPWTSAEDGWFWLVREHPDLVYLERWCLGARAQGVACIWPDVLRDIHNIIDPTPRGGERPLGDSAAALLESYGTVAVTPHPAHSIRIAIERLEALLPDECSCQKCLGTAPPED